MGRELIGVICIGHMDFELGHRLVLLHEHRDFEGIYVEIVQKPKKEVNFISDEVFELWQSEKKRWVEEEEQFLIALMNCTRELHQNMPYDDYRSLLNKDDLFGNHHRYKYHQPKVSLYKGRAFKRRFYHKMVY